MPVYVLAHVCVRVCVCLQVVAAGSWKTAYEATTTVPNLAGDLWESMPAVWQRMRTASYFQGQVVVVGFSNGCIAATEWSLRYPDKVRALLLCSGTPAADQVQAVAAGRRWLPATMMTIGEQDPFFLYNCLFFIMLVFSMLCRYLPSYIPYMMSLFYHFFFCRTATSAGRRA